MNVKSCRQRIKANNSNVPIILVVEDDEDNLLFISQTLILLNHNFVTADTGKDALNLATKYEIDLVILDLVLPDINGFEVISLLKQHKLAKNMPIIAISALARKQEIDRAFEAGCDDYLSKPYFIEDLKQKIRHYLASFFQKNIFENSFCSYKLSAIC
ncbi:response regulator [Pleurocapsa sp. PCC 7319]|uniref:response regulator n=1 Tax=Pleurocapsa sp. PCC 7319 TaxID=118161 RepID=UPI00034B2ED6|nr:response regulator [Pleurocapsa sp. PCC 7319]